MFTTYTHSKTHGRPFQVSTHTNLQSSGQTHLFLAASGVVNGNAFQAHVAVSLHIGVVVGVSSVLHPARPAGLHIHGGTPVELAPSPSLLAPVTAPPASVPLFSKKTSEYI